MSKWNAFTVDMGPQNVVSATTALKRKNKEREEIERLTAVYLMTNAIKTLPCGVRSEVESLSKDPHKTLRMRQSKDQQQ